MEAPVLPERKSIDMIMRVFSPQELADFLRELYDAAVVAVRSGDPKDLDAVRRILLDWEYTAAVKNNPAFLRDLEQAVREELNDDSLGIHWTDLLEE